MRYRYDDINMVKITVEIENDSVYMESGEKRVCMYGVLEKC